MNEFKTTDVGGHSLEWNDLRWMMAGYSEAFKGVLSTFGYAAGDVYILSGCESATVGNPVTSLSIDEGFIAIDGEVCFVPAHSVAQQAGGAGTGYYWKVDSSFDPTGLELFEDANQYNTYEVRRGKVVFGLIPANHVKAFDGDGVRDVSNIKELYLSNVLAAIPNNIDPSVEVGTTGAPAYLNSWTYSSGSNYVPLTFFKDLNGVVNIQGQCENPSDHTAIIFQLPIGYRPSKRVLLSASLIDAGLNRFSVTLEVEDDGKVKVFNMSGAPAAGSGTVYLSSSFRPI